MLDIKEFMPTVKMTTESAMIRAKSIVAKSKFLSSEHAETGKIIEFAIAIIIVAALIPTAITMLFGANTTSWDTATKTIYAIVGVIVVAILVLMLYNSYGKKAGGKGGGKQKGGF